MLFIDQTCTQASANFSTLLHSTTLGATSGVGKVSRLDLSKPSFEITLQKSEIELEQQQHQCTNIQIFYFFKQKIFFHYKKFPQFHVPFVCLKYITIFCCSNDFTVWWNCKKNFTIVQIKSGSSFPNTFFILNWSFLLFQNKNTSHFQPWSVQK